MQSDVLANSAGATRKTSCFTSVVRFCQKIKKSSIALVRHRAMPNDGAHVVTATSKSPYTILSEEEEEEELARILFDSKLHPCTDAYAERLSTPCPQSVV